jgi:hypothetical protein
MVNRMALGDLRASFHGRGSGLIGAWLLLGACVAGPALMVLVLDARGLRSGGVPPHVWLLAISEFAAAIGAIAFAFFEGRYILSHIKLGDMAIGSKLPVWRMTSRVIGWSVVMLLGLLLGVGVTAALLRFGVSDAQAELGAVKIFVILASVFVYLLIANIFRIFVIDRMIVRALCSTLVLGDASTLDRIGQSTAFVPRAGEGLADAFDIGAF